MKTGFNQFARGCLCLAGVLACCSAVAGAFDNWPKKMRITFSGYSRGETLTDFPVLVVFSNNLAGHFNYADLASPVDAGDLRFSTADGASELKYEIDTWNLAGKSAVWVRVPALTSSNDFIYAYWGHPGETTPPPYTTNGTAWSPSYKAVWHLGGTGGTRLDATANRFTGTLDATGVAATDAGMIGGADTFTGTATGSANNPPASGGVNCGNVSVTGSQTIEMWLNAANLTQRRNPVSKAYGGEGTVTIEKTTGIANYYYGTSGNDSGTPQANPTPASTVTVGKWIHLAHVRSLSAPQTLRWYVNGRLVASVAASYAAAAASANTFRIGKGYVYCFNGLLDEVRVSSEAYSSNRVWACWMNTASNAVFQTLAPASTTFPAIASTAVTNIAPDSAWLAGTLSATGQTATAISAFWGPSDGGTNREAWLASSTLPAPQALGAFSIPLTNLAANATYYCRLAASNASAIVWSDSTLFFITGELALTRLADARESDLSPGIFQVARPSTATNEALTVQYQQSAGTAVAGVDYVPLPVSVTLPAGVDAVMIEVAPLKNYGLRADTTLELTLIDAPAIFGAAATATLTIIDEPMPVSPTNVWIRSGTDTKASTAANWSLGHSPTNREPVALGHFAANHSMTWDITNAVGSWVQTTGYTGTVTVATLYPGLGVFTNMLIVNDCRVDGGSWTHPANTGVATAKERLCVTVGGDFTLGPAASINVSRRGFATTRGPGAGTYAQRSATSATTARAASHGGVGSYNSGSGAVLPALCYGSMTAPEMLGSGATVVGGGALKLSVGGVARLDGAVEAVGGDDAIRTAGAGGSLLIAADAFAGTGVLNAAGGVGYWTGGGGRLALIARASDDFGLLTLRASAGATGSSKGAAGTIYLEDGSDPPGGGRVIVDAGNVPSGVWTEFPPAFESYPVHPSITGELCTVALVVTNGSKVKLTSGLRMQDFRWLGSGSSIDLNTCTLYLRVDEPLEPFPQAFGNGTVVTNEGRIVWGDESALSRVTTTNGPHGATSQSPGVSWDFYPFGAKVVAAANPGAGYTFLWWEGDVPVGSNRTSNPLGITVDGACSLLARFVTNDVSSRTWTGAGGSALASDPANWYPAETPVAGNHLVFGDASRKACEWDLDIALGSWRHEPAFIDSYNGVVYEGRIWIRTKYSDQGTFTNLSITGDVTLQEGVWSHIGNTGGDVAADRLSVAIGGRLTLGQQAAIDVTGRGFAFAKGPGAGAIGQRTQNPANARAGSHGGRGADVYGGTNGVPPCYGSPTRPETLGSGASNSGGGNVRIRVGGEAVLEGAILARGVDSSQNSVGSGGSIYLEAPLFSGSGTLDARGGNGYWSGGGGRVAVVATASDSLDNLTIQAPAGAGVVHGAAGTVYLKTIGRAALVFDNQNLPVHSTNFITELPGSYDLDIGSLASLPLLITNRAQVALATDLKAGDLFIGTNSLTTLYLKGRSLLLRAPWHADWGREDHVVYDGGTIIWSKRGSLIVIR